MRLIPRHRHNDRSKAPKIAISEAEIAADLLYPSSPRAARRRLAATGHRGGR